MSAFEKRMKSCAYVSSHSCWCIITFIPLKIVVFYFVCIGRVDFWETYYLWYIHISSKAIFHMASWRCTVVAICTKGFYTYYHYAATCRMAFSFWEVHNFRSTKNMYIFQQCYTETALNIYTHANQLCNVEVIVHCWWYMRDMKCHVLWHNCWIICLLCSLSQL